MKNSYFKPYGPELMGTLFMLFTNHIIGKGKFAGFLLLLFTITNQITFGQLTACEGGIVTGTDIFDAAGVPNGHRSEGFWSETGGLVFSSINDPNAVIEIPNPASGPYTVEWTYKNNTSITSFTFSVVSNPAPSATLLANGSSSDLLLCSDASVALDPGINGQQSYEFIVRDHITGLTNSVATRNNGSVYTLGTNNYEPLDDVFVVVEANNGCKQVSNEITISNVSFIDVKVVGGSSVCQGATIPSDNLEVIPYSPSSGFTYDWTTPTGPVSGVQTVPITNYGTYYVTVTNGACSGGPFISDVVTVRNYILPDVTISGPASICKTALSLTLNSTISGIPVNPIIYQWDFNGNILAGESNTSLTKIDQPLAGSYKAIIVETNNEECWMESNTLNVNVTDIQVTGFSAATPPNTTVCSNTVPVQPRLNISLSGGIGPWTVTIDDGTSTFPVAVPLGGSTTATMNSIAATTTYTIIDVTDATGCSIDPVDLPAGGITYTIAPIPMQYNVTGGTGCEGTGVTIGLDGAGGELGITYELFLDGVSIGTRVNDGNFGLKTALGVYTMTATGINGCVVSMGSSASVNQLPANQSFLKTGSLCPSGEVALVSSEIGVRYELYRDGVSTGTVVNGTGGAITLGVQGVAGVYTVKATFIATGCNIVLTDQLEIQPQPTVYDLTANRTTYCSSAAVSGVNLTLSGTDVGISYQLIKDGANFGGVRIGDGNPITVNNVLAGSYTVEASNIGGCTLLMNYNPIITAAPAPTATLATQVPDRRCANVPGTFNITITLTGTPPFDFDIEDDKGSPPIHIIGNNTASYTLTVNPAATTTYSVTNLVDAASCLPQNGIGSATVYIDPAPVITFNPASPEVCEGSAITVTAYGAGVGGIYSWSDGLGNSQSINVAPAVTHTYTVTATTTHSCSDNNSVTVTVNPLPVVDFNPPGNDYEYCENDANVTLTGNPAGGSFSGTGILAASDIFSPAAANIGNNAVTYTYSDPKSCVNSITKSIVVNSVPNVFIFGLGTEYCANDGRVTFSGSPTAATGVFEVIGYTNAGNKGTWWDDNGNGTGWFDPAIATATVGSGTYTFRYTYTDPNVCTAYDEIDVDLHPDLNSTVSFTGMPAGGCQDDNTNYPLQGQVAGVNVLSGTFTGPNPGLIDGGNDGTAVFNPSLAGNGTHTITFTYTDANGCTGSQSQIITIGTNLDIPGLKSTYCKDEAGFNIIGNQSPNGAVKLTNVTTGAVVSGFDNPANPGSLVFFDPTVLVAGPYTIEYSYTDGSGCTNSRIWDVEIYALPDATFEYEKTGGGIEITQYCVSETSVILTPIVVGGNFTGTAVSGSVFNPSIAGVGTHNITYTITQNGCTSANTRNDMSVSPLPTIDINNLDPDYCDNEAKFTILASNSGTPGGAWTFSSTTNTVGVSPISNVNAGTGTADFDPSVGVGSYTVTMTYVDPAQGCENSIDKIVTIYETPEVNFGGANDLLEFCQDDAPITLTASFNTTVPVGAGVFTGDGITDLGNGTATFDPSGLTVGDHPITYEYTNPNSCVSTRIKTFRILEYPTLFTVTGGGDYCNLVGLPVGLSDSEVGVNYELLLNGLPLTPVNIVAGSGSAITFGNQTAPGVYTVQAVNATSGCSVMMTGSATIKVNDVTLVVTTTDVSCKGGNDGEATVVASGGTVNYNYEWKNSSNVVVATSATASNLIADTYQVTVIDAVGCSAITAGIVINEPNNALNVTVINTKDVASCGCTTGSGICEGSAEVSITGGTPNYTVAWSTGGIGIIENDIEPGNHSVTVTDNNGCVVTVPFTITQLPALTIVEDISKHVDNTCNGGNIGELGVTVSGGSLSFEYSIDNTTWFSSPAFTGLFAGSYDVWVRDANYTRCSMKITNPIVITEPNALTLTEVAASHIDVDCNGGSTAQIEVVAGGGSGVYDYSIDAGASWQVSNPLFTGLAQGSYNIWVRDAADHGCIYSGLAPIVITEPTPLTLTIASVTDVSCNGEADGVVVLTASGGSGNYVYSIDGGANWVASNTFSGLTAGLKNFSLRDVSAANCEIISVVSTTITEPDDFPMSGYNKTDVSCFGGNNGEIVVNHALVGRQLEYSIDAGVNWQTSQTFSNLVAGNYKVWVRDVENAPTICTKMDVLSVDILEPASTLSISNALITDVTCSGDNDGSIDITVSGGTPYAGGVYVYQWTNSAGFAAAGNVSNPQNFVADDYTVIVTDANGCQTTDTYTVTEPAPWDVQYTVTNVSTYGGNDGEIDIHTITGNTPPYSVLWTDGSTDVHRTGLIAGTYGFTVTGSNGCTITKSNIVVTQPTELIATATASDVTCYGGNDGSILVSITSGNPNYTIGWVGNLAAGGTVTGSVNQPNNTLSIPTLEAGTYTVDITDAVGNTQQEVVVVNQPAEIIITTVTITDITCEGGNDGEITVSVAGGVGPNPENYTMTWVGPNGFFRNGLVSTQKSQIGLSDAGNYTISVIDGNGCMASTILTIATPSPWDIQYTVTDVSTNGNNDGSINIHTLTGNTGPYTVTWADDITNHDLNRTGLTSGVYEFDVLDANGCTTTISNIVVTEPTALVATVTPSDVTCNGGNDGSIAVNITSGNPDYIITWTGNLVSGGTVNGTITQTQPTYTIETLEAGVYTVDIADAVGNTVQEIVNVNEPPIIVITPVTVTDITCEGGSDGELTVTVTGGIGPDPENYTMIWNGPNGFLRTGLVSAVKSQTGLTEAGNYTVTVTDGNGCNESIMLAIAAPASWDVQHTVTHVSTTGNNDGVIDIHTIAGNTSPYTVTWTDDVTNHNILRTGLAAGTYEFTVVDANGCTYVESNIHVTEPGPLVATVTGSDVTCFGGNDGSIYVEINSGTANYIVAWTGNLVSGGMVSGTSNPAPTTLTIPTLEAGTYTVDITDAVGNTQQEVVIVNQPAEIIITTVTITDITCEGGNDGEITVSVAGGVGPNPENYTMTWVGPNGFFRNGLVSTQKSQIGLSDAGNYTISVTDGNGCIASTILTITTPSPWDVQYTVTNVSTTGNNDGQIDIHTVAGNTGPYTVTWDDDNTNHDLLRTGLVAGSYEFTVVDANGCDTTITNIHVTEPGPLNVTVTENDVTCFGDNSGSIRVEITSGNPNYIITWDGNLVSGGTVSGSSNPAPTNLLIDNLEAGSYAIEVTDDVGNVYNETVVVSQPNEIVITAGTVTDITCNGGNDGEITVAVTGGSGPDPENYNITWVGPNGFFRSGDVSAEKSQTNLDVAGNYAITVTDDNGCSKSLDVAITAPSGWDVQHTATNVSITGGNDGTISITSISGNSSPYIVTWADDNTNHDLVRTGLTAGTYEFTVVDANLCDTTISNIIITEPTALIVSVTGNDVTCFGGNDGSIDIAIASGNSPYVIDWSGILETGGTVSGTINPANTVEIISSLEAGTYTVDVTDNVGNTVQIVVIIAQPVELVATATVSDISCYNQGDGTISVNLSGPPAGDIATYQMVWNGPSGFYRAGTVAAEQVQNGLTTPGTYDITVFDGNSCPVSLSAVLLEPNELVVNVVNVKDITCNGGADGEIAITVSGRPAGNGYTYDWYKWDGSAWQVYQMSGTPTMINLSAGLYHAEITSSIDGCTVFSPDINVAENDALILNTTVKSIFSCSGDNSGELTIDVNGGVGPFTLDYGNPSDIRTGSGPFVISGLVVGTYSVTVTDANLCTVSDTYIITEPLPLVVNNVAYSIDCINDNTGVLNYDISGGSLDGSNNHQYFLRLSGPGGASYTRNVTVANGGVYSTPFTNLPEGSYVFEAQDKLSSTPLACGFVLNFDLDLISITGTVTNASCIGVNTGAISGVVIDGTSGDYTYLWTTTDGQGLDNSSVDQAGLSAGTYNLSITDNVRGCTVNQDFVVDNDNTLVITGAVKDVTCNGGSDGAVTNITISDAAPVVNYTWTGPGVTNPNIADQVNITGGTYQLDVVDGNGCAATETFFVNEPAAITFDLSLDIESCNPYQRGIKLDNIAGGTGNVANYQFYWTGPGSASYNTKDLTGLTVGGTYTVTVKDENNCEVVMSIVVPEELTITENVTYLSCNGAVNGAIALDIAGGVGAFSYQWYRNGIAYANTKDIDNLNAATYTIEVTDLSESDAGGQCLYSKDIVISEPDAIVLSGAIKHITCSGDADGEILLTVTGGVGNYSYSWSSGNGTGLVPTAKDQSGLSGGTYSVVVTDDNGCSATADFTVIEPTAIDFDLTVTDTQCDGTNGAIQIDNVTGGSGTYTYTWAGPGIKPSDQNTTNVTGLIAGDYTVTVWDAAIGHTSCFLTKMVTLTSAIDLTYSVVPETCDGQGDGAITIDVQGGQPGYTYVWTTADGSGIVADAQNQAGLTEGTYNVTITDTRGCSIMQDIFVARDNVINVVGAVTDILCYGDDSGEIALTISGGSGNYLYHWTGTGTGIVDGVKNQTGLSAGSYTVLVADNVIGCEVTQTYDVRTPAAPLAITVNSITDILCKGEATGTISISVSGGTVFDPTGTPYYNYQWSGPGSFTNSPDQTNLIAGDYKVTVTDANGCFIVSDVITITEPDEALAVSVTDIVDVTTFGGNDGEIEVAVSGGAGAYSIVWSGTDLSGNAIVGLIDDINRQTNLIAGNYNVDITDGNGCTVSLTDIFVNQPGGALQMVITTRNIIPCQGDDNGQINVNVTGGTLPYTITWYDSGNNQLGQVTANGVTIDDLIAGIYRVDVTDANSVTISNNSIAITEPAPLQLSALITQHVNCYESKTGIIRLQANGGVVDGSGHYRIEVTGPNGYSDVRTDITEATDFDYINLASGIYNIRLTDDSNGDGVFDINDDCVVERTLKINQPEAKVTVSLDSEICIGETTQIKFVVDNWADIAANKLTVTLSDGSVVVLDESPHLHTVNPVDNTVYTITGVSDGLGCEKGYGEGSATKVVNPLPTARIYSDEEICFGETATLFVDLTGTGPWTVTWSDGTTSTVVTGIAATPFSFDVTPNDTTVYKVLDVQDLHCSNIGTDSVVVTVNERAAVTISGNADICYGLSTGINLDFSAGTAPYNVTLTENGVSKTLTGIIPDASGNYIYTVTPNDTTEYILQSVTDAKSCDQTVAGSVLVTVRPYPENPGAITGDALVCQGAQGIGYSIDEVKFATNYVWTLPAGATIVSGGGSDSVTVDFDDSFAGGPIRVYAENGCAQSAISEMLINASLLPDAAGVVTGPANLCQSSTGVMYSVSTITNATGYVWTLPAGFNIVSGDGTSSIIIDLNPTIANLSGVITVEGINSCGNGLPSVNFDVTVTPLPVAFAGNDEEICTDTYTLDADVVPGGQTGTWTILKGSGVISPGDVNLPSATVTNLSQGENIFMWSVEVNATGCAVMDTVTIINNQLTVIAAVEERVSCDATAMIHGTPVPAGADGGIWSFTTGNGTFVDAVNPNTQVVNLDPDQNILRWTITKHGCQSYAEVEIINDKPDQAVISNGDYMDICDTQVSLSANSPTEGTGLWTLVSGAGIIDDATLTTINVTGLSKGDNVLRWTIEKNGCFTTDEIVVRNNQLDVDAGSDRLLCDESFNLNATPPPTGVTGRWIVIEGAGTFDDGFIPDATVSGLAQGTNRLVWELDQKGCVSTDTITLTNNQPTQAVVGAQLVVCADTVQLIGNTPAVGAGFWSVVSGSGRFDNVNDPGSVAYDIQEGTNTYRWTITNNGCSSFADQEVENMKVYVSAGKDTSICERTTVLDGNLPTKGLGEWNIVPGMGEATFDDINDPNARVGGLGYGNNVFVWTVTNATCVSRDTVVISNNSPYAANAGTDQIINSDVTYLNATPALIGTGSWSLVSGGADIVDPFNAYTEINGIRRGPNEFRWTVEHLGCTSVDGVIITNGEVIEANAGLDQTICDNWTYLQANDPDVGIGEWSVVSGSGKLESPHNQKSRVYDLGAGVNVFRWTIYYTNSSSTDTVVITNNQVTVANAGPDRDLCSDSFKLEANIPAIGAAKWTVISGGGTFDDDTNPNTVVNGLTQGANVLKYEVSQLGCSSVDSVTVYNNLPTIAIAGSDQTICTDSVELHPNTPTFGTGEWRVEEGSAKFDGNWAKEMAPGGNKLVWVITSKNCVSSDTVHIQNDQPSVAFAGHDRIVCVDSVSLSASIPQYGVGEWEFISGSGDIKDVADPYSEVTGLSRGANRFRWTIDNNGCISSDDVEISNNLIPAIAGANQINCADTAVLEANLPSPGDGIWGVVGGSGSAIFEDTSNPYTVVRGLDQGDNELTWTINYMGCSSVSKVVIRNDNPTKAFAGENIGLCVNTTELSANSPVIGDGAWTLVNGGGAFVDNEDPQTRINNLKFGDNLLRWTITHNTCVSHDDVEVSFNRIDAAAGADLITCSTDTILEANSGLPGVGTWSVVGGGENQAVFVDQNDPRSRVYNLAKGDNLLRWTVSYRGCDTFDEVNIVNNSPSTSYAGNSQELCEDNTVLDATSVVVGQGHWEILTGAASIGDPNDPKSPVSDLSKGDNVFRWTVLHKGCVSADEVLITNNRPSEPYAGHDMDICYSNTTLKADPPEYGSGMWSILQGSGNFSNPTDPDAQVENLSPGVNILLWTLIKGQCSLTDSIVVTNNSPTIANAGPDIEDCKDWSELDANIPTHGIGEWTVISGNGDFDDVNDPKTTVRNLGFGENILMWTVSNNDCFSSDQVVIFNQVPDPSDAGSDRTICEDYVVLNANNPAAGTGTWTVISGSGDFEDSHLFNTKVVNVGFGENVYKWTIAYAGSGCFTESTMTVTSNKAVPFAGDDDTVYEPQYQMQAANPGTLQGTWSVVAGNGDFDDVGFFSTTVRNLAAGKNTFRWSIDVDGCGAYDDVTIWFKEVPDAGFEVDNENGCYPLDVKFTNYSVGGDVFYWDFGDGNTSTLRHPEHTYTDAGEFTVILTVPGPDGKDAVYTKLITAYDHPIADFDVKPTLVYVPGDFIRLYDLSVDAESYLWDFGDGSTSDVQNPSHEYEDEGFYSIQLTVLNEYGCEDVMLKEDVVEAKMTGFVSFANSFMPRPDGSVSNVNAIFKPAYRDVDSYILQIFNRWGQLIYESNDINEGWDGMYKGQLAPQAVYVWKASGTYISGKEFRKTGSVLLVR